MKIPSWQSSVDVEPNHEKIQLGYLITRPSFQFDLPRIHVWNVNVTFNYTACAEECLKLDCRQVTILWSLCIICCEIIILMSKWFHIMAKLSSLPDKCLREQKRVIEHHPASVVVLTSSCMKNVWKVCSLEYTKIPSVL